MNIEYRDIHEFDILNSLNNLIIINYSIKIMNFDEDHFMTNTVNDSGVMSKHKNWSEK